MKISGNKIICKTAKALTALCCCALLYCCDGDKKNPLLAKANGKELHLNDLSKFFPRNASAADSANVISRQVSAWVHKQLMLKEADKYLLESQKNVDDEIEDYRSSLLIYRLEQNYIFDNIDTLISAQEVEKIYDENKDLFVLKSPLLQAKYIKIQSAAPETEQIKKIYLSRKPEDIKQTEDLCLMYAEKYDVFNDNWLTIQDLLKLLPSSVDAKRFENDLLLLKFYEAKDDSFDYFILVKAVLPIGATSPLKYEEQNIRTMILNKRKYNLIKKLQEEIYTNGINTGDAKIYTD